MKKKNGFVFVETMIVVVVLVSILLIIYSSYTSLISIERRQARYDDPVFVYKTHAIADYLFSLKDDDNNSIMANKIEEFKDSQEQKDDNNNKFVIISISDKDLFDSAYENKNNTRESFYTSMYNAFNIQTIVLFTKNSLEKIEKDELSSDFYKYLKSINTAEDPGNQAYIAIMYAEKVNGDACNPNELFGQMNSSNPDNNQNKNKEMSCTFYYSSLKMEELSK